MSESHEEVVGPVEHEEVASAEADAAPAAEEAASAAEEAAPADAAPQGGALEGDVVEGPDWEALVAERTADLQRLQAEYVNYKKRVDRDRATSRQAGVESVLTDLMPVLDSISLARQHDDLSGGFKLVADELEKVSVKYGLTQFGAVGEAFDPNRHDALMAVPLESGEPVEVVTISQVMQQGYALGDRVIRPARVGVANP